MATKPSKHKIMIDQAREAYNHLTQGKVTNPIPEFEINHEFVHITRNKVLVGVYNPKAKRFMAPRVFVNE